jgi:hypothetical protein
MWSLGLRFGFVTNYEYTMFLKRDIVDGQQTLFFSDAISYEAKSIISPRPNPTPKVSLRECMLFLVHHASSNWQFPSDKSGDLNNWVYIRKSTPGDGKGRGRKSAMDELIERRGIRPDPAKPAGTDTLGPIDESLHISDSREPNRSNSNKISEGNHHREHSRDIRHRGSRPGESPPTQRFSGPERGFEEIQAGRERRNQGKRSLWESFAGRGESVRN